MKKIILITILATVFVSFCFYFIVFILPFLFVDKENIVNESRCRDEVRAMEETINGVLINKFRDKESHMWETIDYSDLSGTKRSLIFMNDRSDAFDFIIPGDSIAKKTGSLEVIVKRKGVERKYQLDFGCPRKIN